jgi:hypothetical protein
LIGTKSVVDRKLSRTSISFIRARKHDGKRIDDDYDEDRKSQRWAIGTDGWALSLYFGRILVDTLDGRGLERINCLLLDEQALEIGAAGETK